ncbi:hypothetical protein [Breoghania sp. JC706]|uniref:hypothetical protein n=1 Tax=Breoghania sp. JC706 TaxID=3117732 RepID=UPI00300ACD0D
MTNVDRTTAAHARHASLPGMSGREGRSENGFSNGGAENGFADGHDYPKGSGSGGRHRRMPGGAFDERLARFEERLTQARNEGRDAEERGVQGAGKRHGEAGQPFVLLASLEVPLCDRRASPLPDRAPVPQGEIAARIDRIVQVVGTRLDAALRPGPAPVPATFSLSIPHDGAAGALSGFTVRMDGATLTVGLVFRHGVDPADPDAALLAAATQLAHALQARYPRHGVKVFQQIRSPDDEAGDADATIEPGGGSDLGTLFRQPERGR